MGELPSRSVPINYDYIVEKIPVNFTSFQHALELCMIVLVCNIIII